MRGGAGLAEKTTKSKTAAAEKLVVLSVVPEWASPTAIAKLVGVSARRIQQLTQDGELSTEKLPGGGARKYRTCETIQRYIEMRERKAREKSGDSKIAELTLRKLEAEVALKESQGELHRLKTAIAEQKYIPAQAATDELAAFLLEFRKMVSAMPGRAARSIPEHTDMALVRSIEKNMRGELEAMLKSFEAAARQIGRNDSEVKASEKI